METLADQERSTNSWNVPDMDGDTPVMGAIKEKKRDIPEILLQHLVRILEDICSKRKEREVTELKKKRLEVTELRDVKQKYDDIFLKSIREKSS